MKAKFLSVALVLLMAFSLMSVSNSSEESARKFWGKEITTQTECGEGMFGLFCCTTTTTTTHYVFWIAVSHQYQIETDCY